MRGVDKVPAIRHWWFCGLVCSSVLLLSACSVQLIAPYNATLVSELNQVQQQVNTILVSVKQNVNSPQVAYSHYASQYADIDAKLATMISNVKAIPHSNITLKQLHVLQNAINAMQQLHQKGFHSAGAVTVVQQTLNSDFTAIYRLQYAKQEYDHE